MKPVVLYSVRVCLPYLAHRMLIANSSMEMLHVLNSVYLIFSFFSPAHLAAIHGHADTLSVLLASGVAVDLTRGTDDRTLLHLAALNGHSSCVSMLLQQGASVTSRDGTREG